jgi:hypothetical protein
MLRQPTSALIGFFFSSGCFDQCERKAIRPQWNSRDDLFDSSSEIKNKPFPIEFLAQAAL